MIKPAEIEEGTSGKGFVVTISETGTYSIPFEIIPRHTSFTPEALELVSLKGSQYSAGWEISCSNNCAGAIVLTENLILNITPKIEAQHFIALLEIAFDYSNRYKHSLLKGSSLTRDCLVLDLAEAFLEASRGLLSFGWSQSTIARRQTSGNFAGRINPLGAAKNVLSGVLRFPQTCQVRSFCSVENAAIALAIKKAASITKQFSGTVDNATAMLLESIPQVPSVTRAEAIKTLKEGADHGTRDAQRGFLVKVCRLGHELLTAAEHYFGTDGTRGKGWLFRTDSIFEIAMRRLLQDLCMGRYNVFKGKVSLYEDAPSDTRQIMCEPDIVIQSSGRNSNTVSIVDAKYKQTPSSSDHYQMLAYCLRYKCNNGFLIFPCDGQETSVKEWKVTDKGVSIFEIGIAPGDWRLSMRQLLTLLAP